jgi:Mg2+ and Co2+ transporter CorA
MGYESERVIRLRRQLTAVQAALTNLYNNLTELSTGTADSYQFDSGDGSQRTTRRKLGDIQDQIDRLEAKESHLINELYNMGILSVRLRRTP